MSDQADSLRILGERIREARKRREWTQEDLAGESGLDRSYIGGVERGERNLSFAILAEICAALGCDIATLTRNLPHTSKQNRRR
jgi:transcriptional regulator with XRE-family HTH domain